MSKMIPVKIHDNDTTTELSLEDVQRLHCLKTVRCLESRGNRLLPTEKEALDKASKHMVKALMTPEKERLAVPLPTGFGKSTLINQLISIIHDYELDAKLLVCVSTDFELIGETMYPENPQGILGTLSEMGVTPDTVGVYMSSNYRHGSWDTTDIENKPVLFITHNRVYSAKDYDSIKTLAKGRLVLWDESAQTSAGNSLSGREVKKDIRAYLDSHENKALEDFIMVIDKARGECVIPSEFKEITDVHYQDKSLKMLIECAGAHATIQECTNGDQAVIHVDVKIPDEINCIIFDASTKISKVCVYDPTIKELDVGNIERDYSNCKIICVHLNEGKTSLRKDGYIEKQIDIIKEISGEDSPLVLTNKPFMGRGQTSRNRFDIPAEVVKQIEGASTITWGKERGVNHYSDKAVVANIGITTLARKDLVADYVAITRNMVHQVSKEELQDYQYRKHLTMLHQGFSRVRIRSCVDGKALPTTIILIHKQAKRIASDLKKEVFPGIQVETYKGDLVDSKRHTRSAKVEQVAEYLKNLKENKVSLVKVKKDLDLTDMNQRQWDGLKEEVLRDLIFQWELVSRSFCRI